MSIQVKFPFNYVAMDEDGQWNAFYEKPTLGSVFWKMNAAQDVQVLTAIKVTGFVDTNNDSWKDSLHRWNGSEWEKVT